VQQLVDFSAKCGFLHRWLAIAILAWFKKQFAGKMPPMANEMCSLMSRRIKADLIRNNQFALTRVNFHMLSQ